MSKMIGLAETPKHNKGWGYELWIHNDSSYCGKELVLFEGKKCSIHYHKIKKETFYVIEGGMIVELYSLPLFDDERTSPFLTETFHMGMGDSLVIEPGTPHRFVGLSSYTRFIEFSTQHFEEDSYRIWPGDSQ